MTIMVGQPLLSLRGIGKAFGKNAAVLEGVTLDVEKGEFLTLVGPSGCGKSTLLRLIAGLIAPSAGTLSFPAGRPEIAFVFQEPTLMPWATAAANARLALDLEGVKRGEAEARARAALQRVGLDGVAAYPRQLSGGMKMRVSIARAMAVRPQLLLMDEPFAALDEPSRQALNDDLLTLWREDGMTVVFVTHSLYESAYLSTRVAVMAPGRIAALLPQNPPAQRDESWRLTAEFAAAAGRISAALKGKP